MYRSTRHLRLVCQSELYERWRWMQLDLTQHFQHFIVFLFSLRVAELASCILFLHLFFHPFFTPVSLFKFLVNTNCCCQLWDAMLWLCWRVQQARVYVLLKFGVFLLGFPPNLVFFGAHFFGIRQTKKKSGVCRGLRWGKQDRGVGFPNFQRHIVQVMFWVNTR